MKQIVFRPFIIITACKKGLSVNENHARSMEAQSILRSLKADFVNVTGCYEGTQQLSFMIFGEGAVKHGQDLCKMLDQPSYIIRTKCNEGYLVNRDGTKVLLGTPKEITNDLSMYENYTILPKEQGKGRAFAFVKEH